MSATHVCDPGPAGERAGIDVETPEQALLHDLREFVRPKSLADQQQAEHLIGRLIRQFDHP